MTDELLQDRTELTVRRRHMAFRPRATGTA